MSPRNVLTVWCRLFAGALVEGGLRRVIVSPGSRSTPLVAAFAARPELQLVDVIDERSAAFVALGQARATGVPTALLCTSGTAAAHYFPAVIEAALTHLPLLVITADRPHELQAASAPQTIDQLRLFGGYARAFFDLPAPDASPLALAAVQRIGAQALAATSGPEPGPVQVNLRARKPLEPLVAADPEAEALERAAEALLRRAAPAISFAERHPPRDAIAGLARLLGAARRGLITCGPLAPKDAAHPEAVWALARATGFPVLAECGSQVRLAGRAPPEVLLADGYEGFIASPRFAEAPGPEVIVQLGPPLTSGRFARYLAAHGEARRVVLSPFAYADPDSAAEAMLVAPLTASVSALAAALGAPRALARGATSEGTLGAPRHRSLIRGVPAEGCDAEGRLGAPRVPTPWAERFAEASALTWAEVAGALEAHAPLSELAATRAVLKAAPPESLLVLGNSLPIRHAELACPGGAPALRVLTQRGAAGIDGLISGAAGAALATGAPVTLLVGDVSALHDLGGLFAARAVTTPLALVVLNNDGGRIFEALPVAAAGLPAPVLEHFTTPHGLGFEAAAHMFGLPYSAPEDRRALEQALGRAHAHPGPSLIEVRVPPSGARATERGILARIEARLSELTP